MSLGKIDKNSPHNHQIEIEDENDEAKVEKKVPDQLSTRVQDAVQKATDYYSNDSKVGKLTNAKQRFHQKHNFVSRAILRAVPWFSKDAKALIQAEKAEKAALQDLKTLVKEAEGAFGKVNIQASLERSDLVGDRDLAKAQLKDGNRHTFLLNNNISKLSDSVSQARKDGSEQYGLDSVISRIKGLGKIRDNASTAFETFSRNQNLTKFNEEGEIASVTYDEDKSPNILTKKHTVNSGEKAGKSHEEMKRVGDQSRDQLIKTLKSTLEDNVMKPLFQDNMEKLKDLAEAEKVDRSCMQSRLQQGCGIILDTLIELIAENADELRKQETRDALDTVLDLLMKKISKDGAIMKTVTYNDPDEFFHAHVFLTANPLAIKMGGPKKQGAAERLFPELKTFREDYEAGNWPENEARTLEEIYIPAAARPVVNEAIEALFKDNNAIAMLEELI